MAGKKICDSKICIHGDATTVHLQRWIAALRDHGLKLSVISYREAKIPGVELHDISCSEMRGGLKFVKLTRLLRGVKMLYLLRKAIRKIKPDIIHIHYLMNTPLVFGFLGCKNVIVSPWGNDIIHDTGKEPIMVIIYKRLLLRIAKKITATTHFLARYVKKYTKAEPIVIAFGVESNRFMRKKEKVDKNLITISFIKHLKIKYGPQYLIEAVPHILKKYNDIEVLMIGEGPEEDKLKNLVDKLGLSKYLKFLGRIDHEKVIEILNATDIFVMPSIYESEVFGVAAIEASAMEVPVVASDLGGIREAVVDGETGILVRPGDPAAIAEACLRLIREPDLRKKMGMAGRRFVVKKYDWKDCVNQMLMVYQQFLEHV